MNKRTHPYSALALACLLAVAMLCTACSSVPTPSSAESSEPVSELSSAVSSEASGSETEATQWNSVAEYLTDPTVVEQINSQIAALENSGLTVSVYADGSTLVYDYTYAQQLDLSDESVKQSIVDALRSGTEEQAETYKNIASVLRAIISEDNIKVRLVYNNADGSEIYTCEFE